MCTATLTTPTFSSGAPNLELDEGRKGLPYTFGVGSFCRETLVQYKVTHSPFIDLGFTSKITLDFYSFLYKNYRN